MLTVNIVDKDSLEATHIALFNIFISLRIDKFNSIKLFYTPILIIKRILLKKYYLKML